MGTKMGLIISIEKYQSNDFGLANVKYATNDSEEIKKIFIEKIGIKEEDIFYYKDEKFTKSVGTSEIQYYLRQMPRGAELYIYYVGHGFFAEGRNYLTAYDTSTLDLISTSLSFDELFLDSFRYSGASTCVAFIDACAEGISQHSRGLNYRGIDINSTGFSANNDFKYALYFACSPKEKSISDDSLKHGVWTWFLLRALNGDENAFDKGKYISTSSLSVYLKTSVSAYIKTQTPYSVISSNGGWKLVDFGQEDSFETLVFEAFDEFIVQCNLVNQELDYGVYGDIHNFAQARDLCWEICDMLCADWEEIVTSLEFYMNALNNGKRVDLKYNEQKELLDEFDRLNKSFPLYMNSL